MRNHLAIGDSLNTTVGIIGVGLMGTAGQFCLNQAFRYGQASLVAPLVIVRLMVPSLLAAMDALTLEPDFQIFFKKASNNTFNTID